ncbi:MAG: prepilin-type N-terminal cleavage/methylation domain-containing protein [Lachnospiraceae bacterium]|nr:prepilin-type N-terminal cleavage/methylation domain-containing protein [Lachnospiraceae bacterium]
MKNNKGFSLVELIIVVAIMAVLMGILAPQYIRYVEKTRIRADDSIISDIDKSCQATLADEKYYSAAAATVTVTVSNTGVIATSDVGTQSTAFLNEVNTSVYGQQSSLNKFKSKAYTQGGSTTLTYTFNSTLYTWQATITNSIADSKYYQAPATP